MSKEAMKLALEEMKIGNYNSAAERLEAALAKQEQGEPVAMMEEVSHNGYLYKEIVWKMQTHTLPIGTCFYTTPQQRKPLTDEQKIALCKQFPDSLTFDAITAIEAAHGIKE